MLKEIFWESRSYSLEVDYKVDLAVDRKVDVRRTRSILNVNVVLYWFKHFHLDRHGYPPFSLVKKVTSFHWLHWKEFTSFKWFLSLMWFFRKLRSKFISMNLSKESNSILSNSSFTLLFYHRHRLYFSMLTKRKCLCICLSDSMDSLWFSKFLLKACYCAL